MLPEQDWLERLAMQGLSTIEAAALERCDGAPMLDQVWEWAAVNSGSRNLLGLDAVSRLLAEAFSPLPGASATRW